MKKYWKRVLLVLLLTLCIGLAGALVGCKHGLGNEPAKPDPDPEPTVDTGSVAGQIRLKGGANPNDYSGVTVDFGDTNVTVSVNSTTGAFTATNVEVGKDYEVTASKAGYNSYSATAKVNQKDQTVTLNAPFILNYKRFDMWMNDGEAAHDFSKINDENPSIGVTTENATLNVISTDSYGDVAVSLWMKLGNSIHVEGVQGMFLKFEDGKYVFFRHSKEGERHGFQWVQNFKGQTTPYKWYGSQPALESALSVYPAPADARWMDVAKPLAEVNGGALKDIYTNTAGDGLKITIVRKGETLYAFADDKFLGSATGGGAHTHNATYALPAEYGDDKVQYGFWDYNSKANAVWKFDVEEDISAYMEKVGTHTVTATQPENGTLTFDVSNGVYKHGQYATVTAKPNSGYVLTELTVGAKKVEPVSDGNGGFVYKFVVSEGMAVAATIIADQKVTTKFTLKGQQYGQTVNIASATLSSYMGDQTITSGEPVANLYCGIPYTVKVDNYEEQTFTLTQDITAKTVTLNYKRFDVWANPQNGGLADHNFAEVNSTDPTLKVSEAGANLNVIDNRVAYDDVAVSLWVKPNNTLNDDREQGLFIQFEDGKYLFFRFARDNASKPFKLQWFPNFGNETSSQNWGNLTGLTSIPRYDKTGLSWDDIGIDGNTTLKSAYDSADGLKVTLLRKGAVVYAFANGEFLGSLSGVTSQGNATYTVDKKYADNQVRVGFWAKNAAATATWKFNIETDEAAIAGYFSKVTEYTVSKNTPENGTLTLDVANGKYKLGQFATFTATPATNCVPASFTVDGKEVVPTKNGADYSYTFVVTKNVTVAATFVESVQKTVTLTWSGLKMGAETEIADTTATLSSIFGTQEVTKGSQVQLYTNISYTLSDIEQTNYYSQSVPFTVTATDTTKKAIVNYKRFDYWLNYAVELHDFSKANDANPEISFGTTTRTDQWFNVISRDTYNDVSASLWVKGANTTHGTKQQGIILEFEDGKSIIYNLLYWNGDLFRFIKQSVANKPIIGNTVGEGSNFIGVVNKNTENFNKFNSDEGFQVTVKRQGASVALYLGGSSTRENNSLFILPVEYATQRVKVGFYTNCATSGATWKFDIANSVSPSITDMDQYAVHNAEYVSHTDLSGTSLSFVAKLRMEARGENTGDFRIGIDTKFKDNSTWGAMVICADAGNVRFQAYNFWDLPEYNLESDEIAALNGDEGIYLAITVDTTTGTVTAYLGTDKQSLKQIGTKTDTTKYQHNIERTGIRTPNTLKSACTEFAYGNSLADIGCAVAGA